MKVFKLMHKLALTVALGYACSMFGQNQTPDLSPIYLPNEVPFEVKIEQADWSLPFGIHSGAIGIYEGKWLYLAGRINGLHSFNDNSNNFPADQQNIYVLVIDPDKKTTVFRALNDPTSGLSQYEIDSLSVTSPQYYQDGSTLYFTGGYGLNNTTGEFITFPVLTAIDLPDLIKWVEKPKHHHTAKESIRQISDPVFQVTGGTMDKLSKKGPTSIVMGQNFEGTYSFGNPIQIYTRQVRRFHIIDNGRNLDVKVLPSIPLDGRPWFRRRDLNVVPTITLDKHHQKVTSFVAYSGVFTPTDGIWTVPVKIDADGTPFMSSPQRPTAFKQGMNNYVCATLGLFSRKDAAMYTVFFGGITYGYFDAQGQFAVNSEFPFTNQVTTVRLDQEGNFKQYLMNAQYPLIRSTQSNPGNPLLFGAGAFFVPLEGISQYRPEVLKLDHIHEKQLVGYIMGGIQSTLPNTSQASDSAASPYIFKVILKPKHH